MIRDRIVRRFLSDPEFRELLEKQLGESDPRKLAARMNANWDQFPKELFTEMVAVEGPIVDALLVQQQPRFLQVMTDQIAKVNGSAGEISAKLPETSLLLAELRPAYQNGDAEKFNQCVGKILGTRADHTSDRDE